VLPPGRSAHRKPFDDESDHAERQFDHDVRTRHPLPGFPSGFGSYTPTKDRGVISNGPAPSSALVPGIQVEGWFADDVTKQARFVLRFPDDWNGKLVVAGASGTRSEYNGDFAWSDYVLPKGYAYASQNKGVLNFYIVSLASLTQPAEDTCRVNPPGGAASTGKERMSRQRRTFSSTCPSQ
jgi:hypothetical protein